MPTITETEHRLRDTLNAVASSLNDADVSASDPAGTASPWAPPIIIRDRGTRRRNPVLVFAASFFVVLLVGVISVLNDGTVPGGDPDSSMGTDLAPASTLPSTAEETTPPAGVSPARVEFWAQTLVHWVDVVKRMDTFGPDQPEADARVVGSASTGDPFGDGGSITATIDSEGGQLVVRGEYLGRGGPIDDAALQTEIADLTGQGAVQVETIWHSSPYDDPESAENMVQADYFLTETEAGSRLTVLTVLGRLIVEVETTDPAFLLTRNQVMGIATGMSGISLDLTWDPDHPLSTVVESVPEPAADAWVALDTDLWVAWADEEESHRLWVKSDIQDPTAAPSTDTRSIHAFAGDDFVVIVVGEPIPDVVTVNWDNGSTETVEPTWNPDLDMGFARFDFDDKTARVVEVDGP